MALDQKFVEGLFYAMCQKHATNSEIASIMSHAKSVRDAVLIIRSNPQATRFSNQFNGLSCNWIDMSLCIGENPTPFQAIKLAEAGINRFVDLTGIDHEYFEMLPETCSYYRETINEERTSVDEVVFAGKTVLDAIKGNNRVYLHCFSGLSRSAIIASIVTAVRMRISYSEAIKVIKVRRPVAQPNTELLDRHDAAKAVARLAKEFE